MHRSRINGLLIDCKTDDIDAAARFWADALGRPIDLKHPGSRGNNRMLETPSDELSVQVQRVDHESHVHIDIETDDIPAEVARLEKLGAKVDERKQRWVIMRAPTGQRFCIVRVQLTNWPKNANQWDRCAIAADCRPRACEQSGVYLMRFSPGHSLRSVVSSQGQSRAG
jgi:predicted enzyme related to lactoylglutathione lyase